MLLFM